MRFSTPIFTVIIFFTLAVSASAYTFPIPPQPDFPESEWVVGSSLKYNVSLTQGENDLNLDLRIAILGPEEENRTDLYWVEFDATNFTGLPDDVQEWFLEHYGEIPSTIRMKVLVPYYDLLTLITDPSKFYFDWTDQDFIRKFIFQYNQQVPYDVQPSLIGGFILPIAASEIFGDNLPEDFIENRNIGLRTVEDPEMFRTENSESETTTDAGPFEGWMYTYTDTIVGTDMGTCFYSEVIPIIPFVTYMGNWVLDSVPGFLDIELVEFQADGARSEINGEPAVFDITSLMMMG